MIVSFLRVADGVLWVALTSMRSIAVCGPVVDFVESVYPDA